VPIAEDDFWSLISLLDGRVDDDAVARLEDTLRVRGEAAVLGFADRLAVALHDLDRPAVFRQTYWDTAGGPPVPVSADAFLHARCAVAAGRATYEQVLADPATFSRAWDLDAELLLVAAPSACERLTGREWTHEEPVSYETVGHPYA